MWFWKLMPILAYPTFVEVYYRIIFSQSVFIVDIYINKYLLPTFSKLQSYP